MIPKQQKIRAIHKSVTVLSLMLFSTVTLIGCNSNAAQENVTSETNSLSEDISTKPNIVADKTDITANSTEEENKTAQIQPKTLTSSNSAAKETKTAKINPKKLTPSQVSQVKKTLSGKDVIVDHAFEVNLKDFGTSLFVPASEYSSQPKLGLYLVKDGQVKYTFPLPEDVKAWNFLELDAVSFENKNSQDNNTGILLISKYWAGPGGPGASEPFP
ncbi:MAG: MSCRAMM family adhesin SdrC, partial [Rivularia sp. ALOHA_DT_140]|nr:MSCRAMM family adhesin SdrC [Rivularia sp. ALOHA_DT_140]